MGDYCVIFITSGSEEEAVKIAKALVNEKLAACVNIIPGIRSIYSWKDEICDDKELLLMVKSRIELFQAIEKRVKQLHSYETPEIISISIEHGSEDYLQWLRENTLNSGEQ